MTEVVGGIPGFRAEDALDRGQCALAIGTHPWWPDPVKVVH